MPSWTPVPNKENGSMAETKRRTMRPLPLRVLCNVNYKPRFQVFSATACQSYVPARFPHFGGTNSRVSKTSQCQIPLQSTRDFDPGQRLPNSLLESRGPVQSRPGRRTYVQAWDLQAELSSWGGPQHPSRSEVNVTSTHKKEMAQVPRN